MVHSRIGKAIMSGDGAEAAWLSARHVEVINATVMELFPHLLDEQIEWN